MSANNEHTPVNPLSPTMVEESPPPETQQEARMDEETTGVEETPSHSDDSTRAIAVKLEEVQAAAARPDGQIMTSEHQLKSESKAPDPPPPEPEAEDTQRHDLAALQRAAEADSEEEVTAEVINAALDQGEIPTEPVEVIKPSQGDIQLQQAVDIVIDEGAPLAVTVHETMPLQEKILQYISQVFSAQKAVSIAFAWLVFIDKLKLDSNLEAEALHWTKDGLNQSLEQARQEALRRLAYQVHRRDELRQELVKLQSELSALIPSVRATVQTMREEAESNLGNWGMTLQNLEVRLNKLQIHLAQTEEMFSGLATPVGLGDQYAQHIAATEASSQALIEQIRSQCQATEDRISQIKQESSVARAALEDRSAEEYQVKEALEQLESLQESLSGFVSQIENEWAQFTQKVEEAEISLDGVVPESETQAEIEKRDAQWQQHQNKILAGVFGRLRMFIHPDERRAWEDPSALDELLVHLSRLFSSQRNEIETLSQSVENYDRHARLVDESMTSLLEGSSLKEGALKQIGESSVKALESLQRQLEAKRAGEKQNDLLLMVIRDGGRSLTEEDREGLGSLASLVESIGSSVERKTDAERLTRLQDAKNKAEKEVDELREELKAYANEPTYKKRWADLDKVHRQFISDPLVKNRKVIAGVAGGLFLLVIILILALAL